MSQTTVPTTTAAPAALVSPNILSEVNKLQRNLTGPDGELLVKGFSFVVSGDDVVKKFDEVETYQGRGIFYVGIMNKSAVDVLLQVLVSNTDYLKLGTTQDEPLIAIKAGKKAGVNLELKTDAFVQTRVYFVPVVVSNTDQFSTWDAKRKVFEAIHPDVRMHLKRSMCNIKMLKPPGQLQEKRFAIAVVRGDKIAGSVLFEETDDDKVKVTGEIRGLTKGQHGMNITEFGDLRSSWSKVGDHYNPFEKQHGGPKDEIRHVGDLHNIDVANPAGVTKIDFIDDHIKLGGRSSIIGRCLVIHEKSDDYGRGNNDESKKSGNSGAIIAGGVIGRSKK